MNLSLLAFISYLIIFVSGSRMFKYLNLTLKTRSGYVLVSWDIQDEFLTNNVSYLLTREVDMAGHCGGANQSDRQDLPIDHLVRSYELTGIQTWSTLTVTLAGEDHTSNNYQDSIVAKVDTHDTAPTGNVTNIQTVSVQQDSASLTWDPPECSERGGLLLKYIIEITPSGTPDKSKNLTSTSESVFITKLDPFTEYQARIIYVNRQGQGPFSGPYTFKTREGLPSAPFVYNYTFDDVTIGLVIVEPLQPNGHIDQYHLELTGERKGLSNLYTVQNGSEYVIGKLEPNTTYSMRARARNPAGWGDWSHLIFVRTNVEVRPMAQALKQTLANTTCIGFHWAPPQSDTSQVNYYKVTVSTMGETRQQVDSTVDKGTNDFIQCGLEPHAQHAVTVRVAQYTGQLGQPMGSQMWTEGLVPPKPRRPIVRKTTDTTVTLEIYPVVFDYGPITSYEIRLLEIEHNKSPMTTHDTGASKDTENEAKTADEPILRPVTSHKNENPATDGIQNGEPDIRPVGKRSVRHLYGYGAGPQSESHVADRTIPTPQFIVTAAPGFLDHQTDLPSWCQTWKQHWLEQADVSSAASRAERGVEVIYYDISVNESDGVNATGSGLGRGHIANEILKVRAGIGPEILDESLTNASDHYAALRTKHEKKLQIQDDLEDGNYLLTSPDSYRLVSPKTAGRVRSSTTQNDDVHGKIDLIRLTKRAAGNLPGTLWLELSPSDVSDPTDIIIGDGRAYAGSQNQPLKPETEYIIAQVVRSTVVDVTKHSFSFATTTAVTKQADTGSDGLIAVILWILLALLLLILFLMLGFFVLRYLIGTKKYHDRANPVHNEHMNTSDHGEDESSLKTDESDDYEAYEKPVRARQDDNWNPQQSRSRDLEKFFNPIQNLGQPRYINTMRDNIRYNNIQSPQDSNRNWTGDHIHAPQGHGHDSIQSPLDSNRNWTGDHIHSPPGHVNNATHTSFQSPLDSNRNWTEDHIHAPQGHGHDSIQSPLEYNRNWTGDHIHSPPGHVNNATHTSFQSQLDSNRNWTEDHIPVSLGHASHNDGNNSAMRSPTTIPTNCSLSNSTSSQEESGRGVNTRGYATSQLVGHLAKTNTPHKDRPHHFCYHYRYHNNTTTTISDDSSTNSMVGDISSSVVLELVPGQVIETPMFTRTPRRTTLGNLTTSASHIHNGEPGLSRSSSKLMAERGHQLLSSKQAGWTHAISDSFSQCSINTTTASWTEFQTKSKTSSGTSCRSGPHSMNIHNSRCRSVLGSKDSLRPESRSRSLSNETLPLGSRSRLQQNGCLLSDSRSRLHHNGSLLSDSRSRTTASESCFSSLTSSSSCSDMEDNLDPNISEIISWDLHNRNNSNIAGGVAGAGARGGESQDLIAGVVAGAGACGGGSQDLICGRVAGADARGGGSQDLISAGVGKAASCTDTQMDLWDNTVSRGKLARSLGTRDFPGRCCLTDADKQFSWSNDRRCQYEDGWGQFEDGRVPRVRQAKRLKLGFMDSARVCPGNSKHISTRSSGHLSASCSKHVSASDSKHLCANTRTHLTNSGSTRVSTKSSKYISTISGTQLSMDNKKQLNANNKNNLSTCFNNHLSQNGSPHLSQNRSPHLSQNRSPHLSQNGSPHLSHYRSPHLSRRNIYSWTEMALVNPVLETRTPNTVTHQGPFIQCRSTPMSLLEATVYRHTDRNRDTRTCSNASINTVTRQPVMAGCDLTGSDVNISRINISGPQAYNVHSTGIGDHCDRLPVRHPYTLTNMAAGDRSESIRDCGSSIKDMRARSSIRKISVNSCSDTVANRIRCHGSVANRIGWDCNVANIIGCDGNVANIIGCDGNVANIIGCDGNVANIIGCDGNVANIIGCDGNVANIIGCDGNVANKTECCNTLNKSLKCGDNVSFKSGDNVSFKSGDNVSYKSGDNVSFKSGDNVSFKSGDNVSYKSGDNVSFKSGDNVSYKSGDNVSYKRGDNVSYGIRCSKNSFKNKSIDEGENITDVLVARGTDMEEERVITRDTARSEHVQCDIDVNADNCYLTDHIKQLNGASTTSGNLDKRISGNTGCDPILREERLVDCHMCSPEIRLREYLDNAPLADLPPLSCHGWSSEGIETFNLDESPGEQLKCCCGGLPMSSCSYAEGCRGFPGPAIMQLTSPPDRRRAAGKTLPSNPYLLQSRSRPTGSEIPRIPCLRSISACKEADHSSLEDTRCVLSDQYTDVNMELSSLYQIIGQNNTNQMALPRQQALLGHDNTNQGTDPCHQELPGHYNTNQGTDPCHKELPRHAVRYVMSDPGQQALSRHSVRCIMSDPGQQALPGHAVRCVMSDPGQQALPGHAVRCVMSDPGQQAFSRHSVRCVMSDPGQQALSGHAVRCVMSVPGQQALPGHAVRCVMSDPGQQAFSRHSVRCVMSVPGQQALPGHAVRCVMSVPGQQALPGHAVRCVMSDPGQQAFSRHSVRCVMSVPGQQALSGHAVRCVMSDPGQQALPVEDKNCKKPDPGQQAFSRHSVRCVMSDQGQQALSGHAVRCVMSDPGQQALPGHAVRCVMSDPGQQALSGHAVRCVMYVPGQQALPGHAVRCVMSDPGQQALPGHAVRCVMSDPGQQALPVEDKNCKKPDPGHQAFPGLAVRCELTNHGQQTLQASSNTCETTQRNQQPLRVFDVWTSFDNEDMNLQELILKDDWSPDASELRHDPASDKWGLEINNRLTEDLTDPCSHTHDVRAQAMNGWLLAGGGVTGSWGGVSRRNINNSNNRNSGERFHEENSNETCYSLDVNEEGEEIMVEEEEDEDWEEGTDVLTEEESDVQDEQVVVATDDDVEDEEVVLVTKGDDDNNEGKYCTKKNENKKEDSQDDMKDGVRVKRYVEKVVYINLSSSDENSDNGIDNISNQNDNTNNNSPDTERDQAEDDQNTTKPQSPDNASNTDDTTGTPRFSVTIQPKTLTDSHKKMADSHRRNRATPTGGHGRSNTETKKLRTVDELSTGSREKMRRQEDASPVCRIGLITSSQDSDAFPPDFTTASDFYKNCETSGRKSVTFSLDHEADVRSSNSWPLNASLSTDDLCKVSTPRRVASHRQRGKSRRWGEFGDTGGSELSERHERCYDVHGTFSGGEFIEESSSSVSLIPGEDRKQVLDAANTTAGSEKCSSTLSSINWKRWFHTFSLKKSRPKRQPDDRSGNKQLSMAEAGLLNIDTYVSEAKTMEVTQPVIYQPTRKSDVLELSTRTKRESQSRGNKIRRGLLSMFGGNADQNENKPTHSNSGWGSRAERTDKSKRVSRGVDSVSGAERTDKSKRVSRGVAGRRRVSDKNISRPVRGTGRRKNADRPVSFQDEFTALERHKQRLMGTLRFDTALAHPDRNRFNNILPPEHTRVNVEISSPGDSDYYNASHLDLSSDIPYIAAQSPFTATTVGDFWRMVLQNKVETIVMMSNCVEGGVVKCVQYWADSGVFAGGPVLVETVDQQQHADFIIRTLKVSASFYPDITVTHFQFQTWPSPGVPDDPVPLLELRYRVRRSHGNKETPIVVHCDTGSARTAVFIAMDLLIEQYGQDGSVNVYGFVKRMRKSRPSLVHTLGEYRFIYECLFEEFQAGDTALRSGIEDKFKALCGRNSQTGFSYLMDEFRMLSAFTPKIHPRACAVGLLPENATKNVEDSIIPPDVYRPFVVIQGDPPTNGYINAVFVDGLRRQREFLVTQTPLSNTVHVFWRMVYDYQVQTIVSMGGFDGPNQSQYIPVTGSRRFEHLLVEHINVVRHDAVTIRNLKLCVEALAGVEKRAVRHFQVAQWESQDLIPSRHIEYSPISPVDIIGLLESVIDWQMVANRRTRPIVVCCTDGATSSGVFCACAVLCERLREDAEVDLYHTVKHLKRRRPQFIADFGQYRFLHLVVCKFIGDCRSREGDPLEDSEDVSCSDESDSEEWGHCVGVQSSPSLMDEQARSRSRQSRSKLHDCPCKVIESPELGSRDPCSTDFQSQQVQRYRRSAFVDTRSKQEGCAGVWKERPLSRDEGDECSGYSFYGGHTGLCLDDGHDQDLMEKSFLCVPDCNERLDYSDHDPLLSQRMTRESRRCSPKSPTRYPSRYSSPSNVHVGERPQASYYESLVVNECENRPLIGSNPSSRALRRINDPHEELAQGLRDEELSSLKKPLGQGSSTHRACAELRHAIHRQPEETQTHSLTKEQHQKLIPRVQQSPRCISPAQPQQPSSRPLSSEWVEARWPRGGVATKWKDRVPGTTRVEDPSTEFTVRFVSSRSQKEGANKGIRETGRPGAEQLTEKCRVSPDYAKSYSPDDAKAHNPDYAKTHSAVYAKSHSADYAKTHSPNHAKTHIPDHAKTPNPDHAKTHSPDHEKAHRPDHAKTQSPDHAKTHNSCCASVRSSSTCTLNLFDESSSSEFDVSLNLI